MARKIVLVGMMMLRYVTIYVGGYKRMRITRPLVSIPVGVLLIIITITVGACAPKQAPPPPAPMTALINITYTAGGGRGRGGALYGGQFSPRIIAVSVGATVTWNNTDTVEVVHSVVSNDGLFSNNLTYGQSFSYTFTQNGTFNYKDPTWDNMEGTVIVY